jgi:glycosyltransferase involved in cell wall biosynthesis
MNIVYLHQYFNTPNMAGGTRSFELARQLVRRGHRVRMVTADRRPDASRVLWTITEEEGIQVHWTPVAYSNAMSYASRIGAFIKFAWLAARRAASLGGDVVFATSTPLTIALPGAYAARRLGVPMVFEVRDLWPAVPIALGALRNPIVRHAAVRLERFAYANAAHVVALAPGMKDHVVEDGVPAERVTVIPNGSDLELFAGAVGHGAQLRAAHPWLGDGPVILYCGAIGRINGVGYLASIAAAMRCLNPGVRFAVIGDGADAEGVRRLAADLGVLDKSFFMLGPVAKSAVPAWHDAATAAVALIDGPEILWKHSTQNKFFDAMAAGRPIFCNFRGWQSEIAEKAGAGAILPADPAAAAAQLAAFLADPGAVADAQGAARRLAEDRFDRVKQAGALEQVLLQAVAARSR